VEPEPDNDQGDSLQTEESKVENRFAPTKDSGFGNVARLPISDDLVLPDANG
jgi:hypothetical protein